MRELWCCVVLFPVLLVSGGCGSGGKAEVEGRVTLDGQPVERGSILLVPLGTEGQGAGGAIEHGKYRLAGEQSPGPGNYRVEIRAAKKSGRMVQKAMGKPGEVEQEMVEAVAARFNARTELTVDVRPGRNTRDISVFSK